MARKLSKAGDRTTGILACPRCGGTTFKARRSRETKLIGILTLGIGTLLLPKRRVRCESCGKTFRRG